VFASPLARRIAKALNVDLARVAGSGPNGRVLKADVESASRAGPAARATAAPAGSYEDIPHTNTRRIIAQRLSEAKRSVPHFYLTIDCDADALLAARRQANEMIDDLKLSVNDLVIKAVALALRRVPAANAAWTETAIRRFRDVDLAVAVAAPGGLITPVVRNADAKSLRQISAEMKELAARARESRLRPDEYQGGGFTISNLGMFGIREFAAIINPPQACILAVGASERRAVVRDGALAVATMMTCTLSVDHRAVDGALGAEFLAAFKKLIESPIALFL
jgi:pyruvate dehydrogenase E2 component (dihydrolipoamide acetyltransferase)